MDKLAIVVPCYNEQEVLETSAVQLMRLLESMSGEGLIDGKSQMILVDDGSTDSTWEIIERLCADPCISGIKLAHNAGHQNAVLAGLMSVYEDFDCVVSIDADLQDDIEAIREMVKKFDCGADIVYGVRSSRDTDTFFKRTTAQGFYRFMHMMGADVVYNHADFRLMSRRAIAALADFPERNLFLRGVVPLLGFRTDTVYYERRRRMAGESKYPLKKMAAFAFDGITSFSVSPIRVVAFLGAAACIVAVAVGIYAVIRKLTGHTVAGWTSIVGSIWFLGGLQLMGIGLIGEYIGKIYKEVKRRPRYIIEKRI